MLKIRLMRIGGRKKPFYRVVVVDERAKRTGAYLELLGTYNPLTEPKDIKLKQDRIDHWVKQGAQMSTGFLRIIGKAPQRPPRKPKKERKTEEPIKTEESTPKESAKSESVEAIGEVEPTTESNDSNEEQGAKQTNNATRYKKRRDVIASDYSESTGEASGASRPDEPTESEKKNEGSA